MTYRRRANCRLFLLYEARARQIRFTFPVARFGKGKYERKKSQVERHPMYMT